MTVAFVGRVPRRERTRLARFLALGSGVDVMLRRTSAKSIEHGLRGDLKRTLARILLERSPEVPKPGLAATSSPTRRAFVQSVIRQREPHVVIIEFLRLSYTLFPRPDTAGLPPHSLIDTHDILHRRAERARAWGAIVDQPIDAAQEMRMLADYDAVMAIQGLEAALLREGLPGKPVLVVPHGVAMPPVSSSPVVVSRPVRIGFLGGRDASNLDALDWFVRQVWPGIRSRFASEVELHVAGQVTLAWKHSADGLHIVGPVDSIETFWSVIDIAINPVRFGSGLKIKNVEALAYGRPLLTTSIGAEGLRADGPGGLRIADSALEWTSALSDWLTNPDLAARTACRGRAFAETHLSESAAFAELDGYLDGIRVGAAR